MLAFAFAPSIGNASTGVGARTTRRYLPKLKLLEPVRTRADELEELDGLELRTELTADL